MTITDADIAAAQALNVLGWEHAAQAFAAHRIAGERDGLEKAAAYLDGYAGGHYMAQSCATAIRNITPGDSQ